MLNQETLANLIELREELEGDLADALDEEQRMLQRFNEAATLRNKVQSELDSLEGFLKTHNALPKPVTPAPWSSFAYTGKVRDMVDGINDLIDEIEEAQDANH